MTLQVGKSKQRLYTITLLMLVMLVWLISFPKESSKRFLYIRIFRIIDILARRTFNSHYYNSRSSKILFWSKVFWYASIHLLLFTDSENLHSCKQEYTLLYILGLFSNYFKPFSLAVHFLECANAEDNSKRTPWHQEMKFRLDEGCRNALRITGTKTPLSAWKF